MQAAVTKHWIIKSLAATIEAIFTVCGIPDINVRQCPLSLKKQLKLILGWRQTILGLVVDSNRLTVGSSDEYLKQVCIIEMQVAPKQKILQSRWAAKAHRRIRTNRQERPMDLQADVSRVCCSQYAHNFIMCTGIPICEFYWFRRMYTPSLPVCIWGSLYEPIQQFLAIFYMIFCVDPGTFAYGDPRMHNEIVCILGATCTPLWLFPLIITTRSCKKAQVSLDCLSTKSGESNSSRAMQLYKRRCATQWKWQLRWLTIIKWGIR